MSLLWRWPARVTLPLLLLVAAVLASTGIFVQQRSEAHEIALHLSRTVLDRLVDAQADRIAALIEIDAGLGPQRLVTALALNPAVREAWLVDASGTIRASLRRKDLGETVNAVAKRLGDNTDGFLRAAHSAQTASPNGVGPNSLQLIASASVAVPPDVSRHAHLVVVKDAAARYHEELLKADSRFGTHLGLIALLAMFLWALLEQLWTRRSVLLRRYAKTLLDREEVAPAELAGGDELAGVAGALEAVGRRWHAQDRLLRVINNISSLALRFPDQNELFRESCRVIVERGGFSVASIVIVEKDGHTVSTVASHGLSGFAYTVPPADLSDPAQGNRPLVRALRERESIALQLEDYRDLPGAHVSLALSDGLRSAAIIPLAEPGLLLGALLLMDRDPDAFAPAVMKAAQSVAADLTFALLAHRREQAAQALQRREASALTAAKLGTWEADRRTGSMVANPRWFEMLGLDADADADEAVRWRDRLHPDDRLRLESDLALTMANSDSFEQDFRLRHRDGHWVWIHSRGNVMERDASGLPLRINGVHLDITERHASEEAQRLAAAIVSNTSEGILVCDADGVIRSVNPAFERMTGYTAAEAVGHRVSMLSSGLQGREFYENLWSALIATGHWEGEIWDRRKNGEVFPEWLSITRIPAHDDEPLRFVGQFRDLTEHKADQKRLDLLSRNDPLTGLPNRPSFLADVESHTQVAASGLALLCINLDNFRQINQSFGLQAGDSVLQDAAARMRAHFGEAAFVGRLEGDLFVAALPGCDQQAAETAAEGLYERFRQPIMVGETPVMMGMSIGLALSPEHGASVGEVLVAAQAAVMEAKQRGRNTLAVFVRGRSSSSRERLTLESQLRLALMADELFAVYQPQVRLTDMQLVGIEALVRWQHPTRGELPPGVFIGIAENTGLIVPLGEIVLRKACEAAVRMYAAGLPEVPISVNVSALQFRRDGFLQTVLSALRDSGLDPRLLELELTESVLLRDSADMLERLRHVREQGIRLAIDDFGTGYSSLAYLARMDLDRLKIDQGFVRDMRHSERAEGIVKAVIALGESLHLTVIAEGVEEARDTAHLRRLGCHEAQGYFFDRPLNEADLMAKYAQ